MRDFRCNYTGGTLPKLGRIYIFNTAACFLSSDLHLFKTIKIKIRIADIVFTEFVDSAMKQKLIIYVVNESPY